jgi:hypothetical protein
VKIQVTWPDGAKLDLEDVNACQFLKVPHPDLLQSFSVM